jgi:hypothetical protein
MKLLARQFALPAAYYAHDLGLASHLAPYLLVIFISYCVQIDKLPQIS